MIINATNEALRQRLDGMSTTSAEQHPTTINKLKNEFEHSICLIKQVTDNREGRANCHEYALGLQKSEIVASVASCPAISMDETFISSLIFSDLKEVEQSDSRLNDLIIYFSGGHPSHSGLMKGNKIESKWGSGHIWQHKIEEVPLSYGSEVKFFHKINKTQALRAFCDYAIRKADTPGKNRIKLIMKIDQHEMKENGT
jgi:hypothetical protein